MTYNNILCDTIFPSFIRSCTIDIDVNDIRKEVYQIKKDHESINRSNMGGYHSPVFTDQIEEEYDKYQSLSALVNESVNFVNDTLVEYLHVNQKVNSLTFWTNINKQYDYNVLHVHPHADLIGIYYPLLPNNSGNLILERKDGSEYSNIKLKKSFTINAEEGRLYILPANLWHWVEPSKSNKDRMSISFNFAIA